MALHYVSTGVDHLYSTAIVTKRKRLPLQATVFMYIAAFVCHLSYWTLSYFYTLQILMLYGRKYSLHFHSPQQQPFLDPVRKLWRSVEHSWLAQHVSNPPNVSASPNSPNVKASDLFSEQLYFFTRIDSLLSVALYNVWNGFRDLISQSYTKKPLPKPYSL